MIKTQKFVSAQDALKQHALSAAFPAMSAEDFQELQDSIESIGVQTPITLFEGAVIDGWHRYTAASNLGMECPAIELGANDDPQAFVIAANAMRRHMSQSAKAMAVTRVYEWVPHGGDRRHDSKDAERPLKTNADLAEMSGVGVQAIKEAKVVHQYAAPEIIDAVMNGDMGVKKASTIARLPKEEQPAYIHKSIQEIKEALGPMPELPEEEQFDPEKEHLDWLEKEEEIKAAQVERMLAADDALKAANDRIMELEEQLFAKHQALNRALDDATRWKEYADKLKRRLARYERAAA